MFGLGSFLGSVGSVIDGMDGTGGSPLLSRAEAEAVSGGTFSTGDVSIGKTSTSDVLLLVALVVLVLFILFRGRK